MLDRNRHSGPILLDELKLTAQMQTHRQAEIKSWEREKVEEWIVGGGTSQ